MSKKKRNYRWEHPEKRFFKKIRKDPISGCWLWTGAKSGTGYGFISVYCKLTRVHRFSYELHKGKIPDGLCVLHKCDVRHCVNPDHLFIGTITDNNRDCIKKDRKNVARGEKCSFSKLTEKQAKKIKYSSLGTKKLAEKFNVSLPTISMIKHGHNWKHI